MTEKKYPSDKQDKFMLRLPEGMRERVRVSAEKNGRSMNAEIVGRLMESFDAEGRLKEAGDLSAALSEKIEEARREISLMEKAKSEAQAFLDEIKKSEGGGNDR